MKNKFKKADAQGNKLPEEIGKGINTEHLKKVLQETSPNDAFFHLRISTDIFEKIKERSEEMEVSKSFYVRQLLINHFTNESK